jgi:hypothetical protein
MERLLLGSTGSFIWHKKCIERAFVALGVAPNPVISTWVDGGGRHRSG